MNKLSMKLQQLVADAREYPPGSIHRKKIITQIVRLTSNELWKEYTPYYEDALQQTWLYFCRNLCESGTTDCYDPTRGSIVTWLNAYLKRRLQDLRNEKREEKLLQVSEQYPLNGDRLVQPGINILEYLPAKPDIPPILEEVMAWVKADSSGELRRVHIQGHPHVNCQTLILHRLPPETSWKELSEEFNLSIPTLSSFYRRQCLPRLREFGQTMGYL